MLAPPKEPDVLDPAKLTAEETPLLKEGDAPEQFAKKPRIKPAPQPVPPTAPPVESPPVPEPVPAPAPATPPPTPLSKPDPPSLPLPPDDAFMKLERELAKPDGQEDLKDFTDREKAYYHTMRRERKSRQKAEEDRDAALFRETQLKREQNTPKPVDPLAGKEDTDFLTVKDVREILAKQPPKVEEPKVPPLDPIKMKYLELSEKEARSNHTDFDAVMELADELVNPDPAQLTKLSQAVQRGDNPAEAMYGMIREHPEFTKLFPAAEVRANAKKPAPKVEVPPAKVDDAAKAEQAEKAQAALEANSAKPKTTGHVSTTEGKPAEEYTMEEITSMTDREFARLPKPVRQKYLKLYG